MIGTGYFARLNDYERLGYKPVSICGKAPDWYKGPQFKVLAPKYDFFIEYKNGNINWAEYTYQYQKRVLSLLDKYKVLNTIKNIYPHGTNIVLLCYEKAEYSISKRIFNYDFCHRHLVSNWLYEIENIMEVDWKE